jgi:hypothetical protein
MFPRDKGGATLPLSDEQGHRPRTIPIVGGNRIFPSQRVVWERRGRRIARGARVVAGRDGARSGGRHQPAMVPL